VTAGVPPGDDGGTAANDSLLRLAPGLRLALTNPLELIVTDARGASLVLRHDGLEDPLLPAVFDVLRRPSFSAGDFELLGQHAEAADDVRDVVRMLLDNSIIIEDLGQISFGDASPLPVSVIGIPSLVARLVAELGAALSIRSGALVRGVGYGDMPAVDGVAAGTLSDLDPTQDLADGRLAAAIGDADVCLYLGPLDIQLLEALNDLLLPLGRPFIPLLLLDARSAVVGPLVLPGRTACVRDLLLWLMNSDVVSLGDGSSYVRPLDAIDTGPPVAYRPLELLALGHLAEALLEFARTRRSGRIPPYAGRAMFINLERKIATLESVLRIPGCPACSSLTGALYSEPVLPGSYLARLLPPPGR
jgi:hypothetical protein